MDSTDSTGSNPDLERQLALVRLAYKLFVAEGDVVELRAPWGDGSAIAGYFNLPDHFVASAVALRGFLPGVYMTMNPVRPELLLRYEPNTLADLVTEDLPDERHGPRLTRDHEILCRRFIVIDADWERPRDTSTTDAEHAAALAVADHARAVLLEWGVPETSLVSVDSGNGGHEWLYLEALENTPEARELVDRFLGAVAAVVDTATVHVDRKLFNASRIIKVPGTWAAKGVATPERPHRLATFRRIPAVYTPCPRAVVEAIAQRYVPPPRPERPAAEPFPYEPLASTAPFDVRRFLADHRLAVRYEKGWEGAQGQGTLLVLPTCPFSPEHGSRGEVSVILLESGMLLFQCFHDHCHGKWWRDVRRQLDPLGVWRAGLGGPGVGAYAWAKPEAPTGGPQTNGASPHGAGPEAAPEEAPRGAGGSPPPPPDEPDPPADDLPPFPASAWRGIFEEYRRAVTHASEVTDAAHFFALWSTIACRLRRRVWTYMAGQVFPNVYLVHYGPTNDKKTTALRFREPLMPGDARVAVTRGIGSVEAMGDWMAQSAVPLGGPRPAHLVQLDELCTLLVKGNWQASGLLPFLVECFDCPPIFEIPYRNKPVRVKEPTVLLYAGTTPDWFWKNIQERDFHGGFGNRLFFGTGQKKAPLALPPKPDPVRMTRVAEALDALDLGYEGELWLAADAEGPWQDFYERWNAALGGYDEMTAAALQRIPVYALKLALAYAAVEGTGPRITAEEVTAAIAVAEWGAACTQRLIALHTSQAPSARCEALVLTVLRRQGPLPPWQIHRRISGRFSAEELRRALAALAQTGVVSEVGRTPRGEPIFGPTHWQS
jgi:hypothetical protein